MHYPHRLLAIALFLLSPISHAAEQPDQLTQGSLTTIEPNPEAGFHHPYLIYIPDSAPAEGHTYLLVEPNNTGKPSDDYQEHIQAAEDLAARNSVGHQVANELGVPFLVPIFPRPMSDWQTYTHALDSNTMAVEDGPLHRIDLQLLAMIKDARSRLNAQGYGIPKRVLLTGFSASGTFINRFVMLHPNHVKALAAGGINGVLFLPTDEIDGHPLPYPIGTNNFEELTGAPFDLDAVNEVPQFYYMGAHDDNDAVQFDDAYNEDERQTIYATIGESIQPERWKNCQEACKEIGLKAKYKTFTHIGHGTDQTVIAAVTKFLKDAIKPKRNPIKMP